VKKKEFRSQKIISGWCLGVGVRFIKPVSYVGQASRLSLMALWPLIYQSTATLS